MPDLFPNAPDARDLAEARVSRTLDEVRAHYLKEQLAGDRRAALRVLDEALLHGYTTRDLQFGVVQEAQRQIGVLWQENKISVADEHKATAIAQLALAQLFYSATSSPRNGFRVVLSCVEGELHELPVRLVADHLDLMGYDVRFLGANVPLDHLLRCLETDDPDLLALSATMTFNVPALKAAVAAVRKARPGLRIAVGGNAMLFTPQLSQELAADLVAPDAAAFYDGLQQFSRRRS